VLADEFGVDVDLGHIVDDDGDAAALGVAEDVVEDGGLAGAEEAGEHGDGKAAVDGFDVDDVGGGEGGFHEWLERRRFF